MWLADNNIVKVGASLWNGNTQSQWRLQVQVLSRALAWLKLLHHYEFATVLDADNTHALCLASRAASDAIKPQRAERAPDALGLLFRADGEDDL